MTKKIRKKLLGFEVGMTCYSTLEKDEEDIIILLDFVALSGFLYRCRPISRASRSSQ